MMPIKKAKKNQSLQLVENIFNGEAHHVIFAEIAYLKKRIHLVEGERKANYEINEEKLKNNAARLTELKQNQVGLKARLAEVVKSSDNYFLVISHKLGSEKQAYGFRNKTLDESIDILESKIGDFKNKENLQTFKKIKLKKQLEKLNQDEAELRQAITLDKAQTENPRFQELNAVENATALMEMKIVEAENIRSRYKHMIEILQGENYNREIQMTEMRKLSDHNAKELASIRQVLEEAEKAKRGARLKLSEVESKTIQEYGEREQGLLEHRHRLKQIRDKMEAIGAKLTFPKFHMVHRDSSVSEGMYAGIAGAQQETKGESEMEILYERLSEMTGESDPLRIVARFKAQRQHSKELEVQEKDAKAEVRRCKIRKKFLQDKVNQIQFSGGLRRETLDERTQLITKEMDSTDEQRLEADKSISFYTCLMDEMMVKLYEICEKNAIKVPYFPPPSSIATSPASDPSLTESGATEFLGHKILMVFKCISSRLEHMFEEQDIPMSSTTMEADTMSDVDMELNMLTGGMTKATEVYGKNMENNSFKMSSKMSSADDTSASAMRRLSVIDLISNDGGGDVIGRNISGEMDGFADLDDLIVTTPVTDTRDDDIPGQILGKSDSSEEEEAVTRITIKRQSQIIVESKTRKGRFNPGMALPVRRRV